MFIVTWLGEEKKAVSIQKSRSGNSIYHMQLSLGDAPDGIPLSQQILNEEPLRADLEDPA